MEEPEEENRPSLELKLLVVGAAVVEDLTAEEEEVVQVDEVVQMVAAGAVAFREDISDDSRDNEQCPFQGGQFLLVNKYCRTVFNDFKVFSQTKFIFRHLITIANNLQSCNVFCC